MKMQQNLNVYIVPVGATMREVFCQELTDLDYNKGVLILPTGLLQEQVHKKYNIAVCGFDTLANKILNMNGYAYLEEINYRSQQLMVKETLDYYAEQGLFHYFSALKEKRGFLKHMTALISQLSRSGATAEEISNTLNSWERAGSLGHKDREVALIYQGYRNLLKLQDRFDLEGKYRLALKILKEQKNPKLPWKSIYLCDFATFDSLQLELLQMLSGFCQVKVGMCYEEERNVCSVSKITVDRLKQCSKVIKQKGSSPLRTASLQHIVEEVGNAKTEKITLGKEKNILLREYKDQQTEIRGVLAEIKADILKGAALQDYAVAAYDLSNYSGLRLLGDEYGIPLTLPRKEQLLVQPFTEFLLQLLKAVPDGRQGAEAYFKLLSGGIGKLLFNISLENMETIKQDCFFKQRSAVQSVVAAKLADIGRPQLLDVMDAFLVNCKKVNTIDGFSQSIMDFVAALNLPLKLGDLYKNGHISLTGLQSVLGCERKLIDSLRALKDDYEKCKLAGETYTILEFVELWQEELQDISIVLESGRKDGLLVTNVVQLQGTSFKKVYIVGLREGEFPAGNRENWLYNDKERGMLQGLGIDLPNTFTAYASDYCLFAGACAAAKNQLVLSFYRDAEGEESPYLDEVQKLFTDLDVEIVENSTLASLKEALGKSQQCEEGWLEKILGAETLVAASIDKNREGVFGGIISDQELIERLNKTIRHRFSASSLEQYVNCPFKYLGVQLWQQGETAEKTELIDGGTRGSLLHETMAEFVRGYINSKPVSYEKQKLLPQLWAVYADKVAEFKNSGKIYENEYWPAESKRLERILEWWLGYELEEQKAWLGFKPIGLEKGFGAPEVEIGLETEDKHPVYLRGRIDRIDASDNQVFITDYKSGTAPGNGDFEKGEDLQMAFYLLAAECLFPNRTVLGGNYLSLKRHVRQGGVAWSETGNTNIKVNGKKNAPIYNSWNEVKETCESMILKPIEELYKGNFSINPKNKDACSFCPLKDVCRNRIIRKSFEKEAN